ncbi:gem-associated protein 5-like [Ptychodera flava]|uniref:gem-associated protein 5-like n=1 Tax=Ptychodera flava TaxID=63121 RepID=UPI00396A0DB3
MDDTSKARVWVALYWPKNKPREIVSSSHGGDLLFWDICKPGKQKWRLIGQGDGRGHNRIIFTVLHGGDTNSNSVITMSMDRQIILWNLASSKAVYCVPTLGGYVYSMVSSPIDAGRLAVGIGDNMIRIWNTSSPVNAYDVTVLWQGTRSKVTALCWHPLKEGHLAYGTDDGRVGIYDVFAQKPPNISSSYHKKTVYSVGWGPPCPGTGGKSGGVNQNVYSCGGDGIVLQHNPYRIYDDAEDINNLIKKTNDIRHKIPQRTELAWKPDESVLAIGNDDGSVEIFLAPNLLLLCSIHVHYKIINCVRWYPDWTNVKVSNQSQKHQTSVSSDHDQSNRRNWLAVGSNDPPIHIYDLTDIFVSRSPVRTPITSSYCTLNGHTQRVTGLSWSPHGDQKLVSVSYDGTAQVWDVSKGEPISNYRGHHGRLFSVVWSGTSHETIYTGGEDFTVQRWRVSQQEHTKPPKSRRTTQLFLQKGGKSRSKNKSKQKNETKDSHEVKKSVSPAVPQSVTPSNDELKILEELVEQKIEELKSTQTNVHEVKVQDNEKIDIPVTENMPQDKSHLITSQLLDDVQIDLKEVQDEKERKTVDVAMETGSTGSGAKRAAFEKRKRRQKSLLPKSSFLDNRGRNFMQEDCKMLAQSLYTEDTVAGFTPGIADQCNMGLFADRKAAFRLFNEEGSYHMEQGNLENYLQLEIWKGNIGKAIQVAKERGQLNEWLVSMAPLGGHDLWLQTAEAYARQLCSQELYLKASSYLVACHKVYDAIEVLKEHKFIKEAVALAKVRLSPSDPVLIELYQTWASQLENDGNFEFAAKCYLAAHQACDAVRLLSRRGDIPALRAACQVALYTNEQEQATSLALQCANQCQENADWLTAHSVLSAQKNVQVYQLQLIVHQELVKTLLETKSVSSSHYQDAHFAEWQIDDAAVPEWMASLSQSVREYLQPMAAEEGHCWWAAHTVKEPFYSHVMKIWSHVYHHQITKEDFSDFYRTLSVTKQMKGGQLNQREVLSHVSYDMTLALLSIMTSQISTALGHWHQAITVCHERGFYDIEQVLFRIVATHGKNSHILLTSP